MQNKPEVSQQYQYYQKLMMVQKLFFQFSHESKQDNDRVKTS